MSGRDTELRPSSSPSELSTRSPADESTDDDSDEQPDVGASETPTPMTDHDWMEVLSPKISSRNFKETFYWAPFVREFVLHLFHPFLTPFVWAYHRITGGSTRASLFLSSHIWALSLTRPIFSKANLISIIGFFLFSFLLHSVVCILVVLAFIPRLGKQDYTHEAIFLLAFRICWCLVVGVKYGFYSLPLQHTMTIRPVPTVFITSEQILYNWAPKLDRLMFELRVASSHAPVPMASLTVSISKKHPVAMYCQKCSDIGDVPLCLLQPSLVSDVIAKLPVDNFHSVFWSKPPPFIEVEGKEYRDSTTNIDVASYKPFLPEFELKTLHRHTENAASTPSVAVNLSTPKSSEPRRRVTLYSGANPLLSEPDSPSLLSQTSPSSRSDYVSVPASVLVAYSVSRCWNFGRKWIGESFSDTASKAWLIIQFLNAVQYALPGVLRVLEPSLCSRLNCGLLCKSCPGFEPAYFGDHWADIVCHVCWAIGSMFWFRILMSFIAINMFELFRRAKLTEEWADTLRHGLDSSLSTGMCLTSKESVMNWYYCREVLRRFRSKIQVRLTAVTFFIFLLPACSLAALGVGLFDSAAVTATGVTPKFFGQTLFYAFVFLSAIVLVVYLGSQQNKAARHESLMFAQLIAHVQYLSCTKDQTDPSIRMSAVNEVRDGLITVHSTLRTIHGMDPEKIFFVLPANLTILSTIASGFAAIATALFQRVTDHPCAIVAGIKTFYDRHDIRC